VNWLPSQSSPGLVGSTNTPIKSCDLHRESTFPVASNESKIVSNCTDEAIWCVHPLKSISTIPFGHRPLPELPHSHPIFLQTAFQTISAAERAWALARSPRQPLPHAPLSIPQHSLIRSPISRAIPHPSPRSPFGPAIISSNFTDSNHLWRSAPRLAETVTTSLSWFPSAPSRVLRPEQTDLGSSLRPEDMIIFMAQCGHLLLSNYPRLR
jgi:hypothetical protein